MELSIIRDGHRFPYSETELRRDNPTVLFPKGLVGVDFDQYNVIAEESVPAKEPINQTIPLQRRVTMHSFLYALREFNLRTQFENYVLGLEGHARDYWFTSHYVVMSSTYVKAFAEFFNLTYLDLKEIWHTAGSIEE